MSRTNTGLLVLSVVLAAALSYGAYEYQKVKNDREALTVENARLSYESTDLSEKLGAATQLNDDLKTLLEARQKEKEAIGEQVQSLSSTVTTLDKLSKIDRELLEKYSSVYFLNENYIPQNLAAI